MDGMMISRSSGSSRMPSSVPPRSLMAATSSSSARSSGCTAHGLARKGARQAEATSARGVRPAAWRARTTSKATSEPMLCPSTTRSSVVPAGSEATTGPARSPMVQGRSSAKRAPRPGYWPISSRTSAGRYWRHSAYAWALPPAWGRTSSEVRCGPSPGRSHTTSSGAGVKSGYVSLLMRNSVPGRWCGGAARAGPGGAPPGRTGAGFRCAGRGWRASGAGRRRGGSG